MEQFVLDASPRATQGATQQKAKQIRSSGRVPGILYGSGVKSFGVALEYQVFKKAYDKCGDNTIISLTVDGKTYPVLVHDMQFDPVSGRIAHVDFMHIDMNKEVNSSVKLVFIGTAPAVKDLGGILDIQKHELKIRCLPKDLVHSVEVDVSPIIDFRTSVHVKDVVLPKGIKVTDNPEDAVVTATPQRVEKEEKPADAAAVPVEGAAAAAGATPAPGTPAPAAK